MKQVIATAKKIVASREYEIAYRTLPIAVTHARGADS